MKRQSAATMRVERKQKPKKPKRPAGYEGQREVFFGVVCKVGFNRRQPIDGIERDRRQHGEAENKGNAEPHHSPTQELGRAVAFNARIDEQAGQEKQQ